MITCHHGHPIIWLKYQVPNTMVDPMGYVRAVEGYHEVRYGECTGHCGTRHSEHTVKVHCLDDLEILQEVDIPLGVR